MARRAQRSPVELAVERLAKMSENGASSARVRRAAHQILTVWRETADSGVAKHWAEALHNQMSANLAAAEDQASKTNARDPDSAKRAKLVARSLRAARDQVAAEAEMS